MERFAEWELMILKEFFNDSEWQYMFNTPQTDYELSELQLLDLLARGVEKTLPVLIRAVELDSVSVIEQLHSRHDDVFGLACDHAALKIMDWTLAKARHETWNNLDILNVFSHHKIVNRPVFEWYVQHNMVDANEGKSFAFRCDDAEWFADYEVESKQFYDAITAHKFNIAALILRHHPHIIVSSDAMNNILSGISHAILTKNLLRTIHAIVPQNVSVGIVAHLEPNIQFWLHKHTGCQVEPTRRWPLRYVLKYKKLHPEFDLKYWDRNFSYTFNDLPVLKTIDPNLLKLDVTPFKGSVKIFLYLLDHGSYSQLPLFRHPVFLRTCDKKILERCKFNIKQHDIQLEMKDEAIEWCHAKFPHLNYDMQYTRLIRTQNIKLLSQLVTTRKEKLWCLEYGALVDTNNSSLFHILKPLIDIGKMLKSSTYHHHYILFLYQHLTLKDVIPFLDKNYEVVIAKFPQLYITDPIVVARYRHLFGVLDKS